MATPGSSSISSMQNPSLFLYGPGDAKYGERPIPQIEEPDDVIVRVAYTGVCGSDVHFWVHGGMKRHVSPDNPLVMGHEASGIVHQVGPSVTDIKPGDHVALEPGYSCRNCARCKAGRYNLCPKMRFAGDPPVGHGTLTKFFKLPADYCYKIPAESSIGLEEAVLIEPLAVAVHTARQVGVTPGDQVVVFGAGTIGLLCAAVAREFGASKIVAVDINGEKLRFAEKFLGSSNSSNSLGTYKPDSTLSSEENAQRIVETYNLGSTTASPADDGLAGADIVIDATGAEPCIQTGIHVLRTGGTFIQTGLGKHTVAFPITTVANRELTVKGCFRYGPGDYKLAIALASEGRIPPLKTLITKVLPFEQATEAWETTRRGEGIKTLIRGVQD
ncbi:hypothetical protein VTN77DRAFT_5090 [Rasamsonia byssochlamydoides]|uniref:uncharacterized protein n=1 Tax=Rasamsonia byssochlamydoides TaxID=89139 RepID=UPI0037425749